MTNKMARQLRGSGARASDPTGFGLRDLRYLENYGCYPNHSTMELETDRTCVFDSLSFRVLKLIFDSVTGAQVLRDVPAKSCQLDFNGQRRFTLSFDLKAGYYILLVADKSQSSAVPFVVSDYDKPADVAVIRPVFTQWSYHSEGFYSNGDRSSFDGALSRDGHWTFSRLKERVSHGLERHLGFPGVKIPSHSFPAHSTINLGDFYRRNKRWERTMWDAQWGRQEGLWVDEVLSGMPIFALLEKNAVHYHVYTDVDLHNQNPALENYRALIFSGQEGITRDYYEMLERLQSRDKTSFLLWGVQGFGYRQLDYDPTSGALNYVCTRGNQGMWGDQLEDRWPDWTDEAKLFGFHFPEPQSATWRYDKLYSRITINQFEHAIIRAGSQSKTYHYEVCDATGASHPGLTWAGGEIQERVAPEAQVIAYLDDDREIIGIGEYRNTVIFAPTYLPAFFAYQSKKHPEIEAWFMATLNYLIGRQSRCGYA